MPALWPRYAILTSSARLQSPIKPGLTTDLPPEYSCPLNHISHSLGDAPTPTKPCVCVCVSVSLSLPPADQLQSCGRLAIIICHH